MDPVQIWKEHTGHIRGINEHLSEMKKINMCGTPQPEYLFSLALSLPKEGVIVEIGTCSGISLVCLAMAQKIKGGRPVTSIDIEKHSCLDKNLSGACVSEHAICILSDANEVAKTWKDPIFLLWIDGDHSYKGAAKDIDSWEKFVVQDGLIAFHDYNKNCGVFRAIIEKILSRPWVWRVISDREYGSIFVAKRISTGEKKWEDPLAIGNKIKSKVKRIGAKLLS